MVMIGIGAFLLGVAGVGAQNAPKASKQPTVRDKAIMRLTASAVVIKTAASMLDGMDGVVEKWGSETFKAKWKKEIGAVFEKEEMIEWADFFSSATVWLGGVERSRGVVGFYSPWSDGVLLVLMETVEDETQLLDFAVVSGESLRGGMAKDAPPESFFSLYPPNEPLIVALARLYGSASAAFAKRYPLDGGKAILLPSALGSQEEILLVKARMVMRMKMFKEYVDTDNQDWAKAVANVRDAVRSGNEQTLLGALVTNQNANAAKVVCALPKEVLQGMKLNYFIPGNDKAGAGFINPDAPRWVVTATFQGKPQDARIARVELLDLEVSDKVVTLWDKGGTK